MTQDEIIRMAREAGFEVVDNELRLYFDGSKALLKPNYMGTIVDGLKEFAALVAANEREKQAEQEPVGHLCEASFGRGQVFWFNKPADNTPLYATPVCTKDLTDDEAQKLWHDTSSIVPMWAHHLHFARAVIAAYKEKNK